jgi:4-hydroxy-tetrahydrodipicolinate synthase
MYLHFKAIAEAVNIPQILYNVPGRTASDLLPETVGRLSELSNIIGIKEATGDVSRVQQIKQLSREGFELYTGEDANTVDFILAGGQGVISVTANVAPKLMHEMCQAALAGDETLAREINLKLVALHQFLFVESNPIPVKWALSEMRLISSGIRLPMTVLSENYHQSVRDALNTAGVLN